MADLYKYRCYCTVDAKYVYEWRETTAAAPSACVENTAHAIDTTKTVIVESVLEKPLADADGAEYSRPKYATPGWSYHMRGMELETSKLGSLVNQKVNPTTFVVADWGDATLKFYDSAGTELTTQAAIDTSCVATVLDFEPTHDMEIIGGIVGTLVDITQDVHLWVIGVPTVPEEMNGSKPFVSGVNLNYLQAKGEIKSDGRTTKRLNYDATNHTNRMRAIFRHPAGAKYRLEMIYEIFKP